MFTANFKCNSGSPKNLFLGEKELFLLHRQFFVYAGSLFDDFDYKSLPKTYQRGYGFRLIKQYHITKRALEKSPGGNNKNNK